MSIIMMMTIMIVSSFPTTWTNIITDKGDDSNNYKALLSKDNQIIFKKKHDGNINDHCLNQDTEQSVIDHN